MDTNPVIEALGRRLRLAVVGGGPGSFIGAMHRAAARIDDRYDLVAGVLSSDPERSHLAATAIGIEPDRAYTDADRLFAAEQARPDGATVRPSGNTSASWQIRQKKNSIKKYLIP